MKKIHVIYFSLLFTVVLIITSCQKQIINEGSRAGSPLLKSGSPDGGGKQCRLLIDKGLSDGFIQSYQYNEKGLADDFHIGKPDLYDYSATMSYGNRNELRKARFFYAPDVFYDIVFEYEKGKIKTETWYEPGTNIVADGYINTYNKKGQLVKRDEPAYEYYCLFQYDYLGNPYRLKLFDYQGNLVYGEETVYDKSIKNPFVATPGLPESIFFTDWVQGPNRFIGLKQYFYDDQGNQVIFFNWKPEETEIIVGANGYPVYQNSRDDVSGIWTDQTWTYENCNGNNDETHHNHAGSSAENNPFKKLLHARKSGNYKTDLLNFRKSFLEKHKQ